MCVRFCEQIHACVGFVLTLCQAFCAGQQEAFCSTAGAVENARVVLPDLVPTALQDLLTRALRRPGPARRVENQEDEQ